MRHRLLFAGGIVLAGSWVALGAACNPGGRTDLAVIPPDAGSDAPPVPDAAPPPIEISDKVDLLLVIDNSPNTDDFRTLFGATAPYLLDRFAHPACVNGLGNVVAETALHEWVSELGASGIPGGGGEGQLVGLSGRLRS